MHYEDDLDQKIGVRQRINIDNEDDLYNLGWMKVYGNKEIW